MDEATERMERQREFQAEALQRLEHMDRTAEHVEFEDMRRYALALAAGERNPQGPVGGGLRELVIGRDARGYVVRYRYDPVLNEGDVAALRAQREAGFND